MFVGDITRLCCFHLLHPSVCTNEKSLNSFVCYSWIICKKNSTKKKICEARSCVCEWLVLVSRFFQPHTQISRPSIPSRWQQTNPKRPRFVPNRGCWCDVGNEIIWLHVYIWFKTTCVVYSIKSCSTHFGPIETPIIDGVIPLKAPLLLNQVKRDQVQSLLSLVEIPMFADQTI